MMQNLFVRELRQNDGVSSLSLGDSAYLPLKSFLKKDALDFHLRNIAKTYVLIDQNSHPRIWGYISLMCSELSLDEQLRAVISKRAKHYSVFPAIKLARLAIDKSLQGRGFGQLLVNTVIAITKDHVMPNVGCRFLTVDAKPEAVSFYKKLGFVLLDIEENTKSHHPLMLLDMDKFY